MCSKLLSVLLQEHIHRQSHLRWRRGGGRQAGPIAASIPPLKLPASKTSGISILTSEIKLVNCCQAANAGTAQECRAIANQWEGVAVILLKEEG